MSHWFKSAAIVVLVVVFFGCATRGRGRGGGTAAQSAAAGFGEVDLSEAKSSLFIEPSIRPGEVTVRRVAVVPNRLPANLRDPEKWRKINWKLIEREFRSKNFDVVDYETSVAAFERSGLPVEDTRSSRDKYAELAAALGVDAVIIPYYGALHYSEQVFLVASQHFVSVLTFQVYYPAKNDFGGRIDASGEVTYQTGEIAAGSMLTGMAFILLGSLGVGAEGKSGCRTVSGVEVCDSYGGPSPLITLGGPIIGIGTLVDAIDALIKTAPGGDHYWEQAFAQAVTKGLQPWFAAYSAGVPSTPPPPRDVPMPAPYVPPSAYPPPPSGGYQPPPPTTGGCQSNADCKAGRVCVQGACTSPR